MEEKSLEDNFSAVKDKYREPVEPVEGESIGEKPVDFEKKVSLEKEAPLVEEKTLAPAEKLAGEKAETVGQKRTETESIKEKFPAEAGVSQSAGKEPTKEEVKPAVAPPSARARKEAERLKSLELQDQIKALSNLAFEKGLDFAIETAKALDNPHILDAFHDNLVDKLYQKLIEQGKLKKL